MSDRDGSAELYVMDADGTNLTRLTSNTGFRGVFGWSSDGAASDGSAESSGLADRPAVAAGEAPAVGRASVSDGVAAPRVAAASLINA